MTEFEIGELLYDGYSLMTDSASMYFTLVSAYLVVSYLVGKKLATGQMVVINTLYVIWTLQLISVQYDQLISLAQYKVALAQVGSSILIVPQNARYSTWVFILVQISGLFASLYFMWTVRHPKTK